MSKKTLKINVGQHTSAGVKAVNQDFHGVATPKDQQLSTKGVAIAIADGISTSQFSQIASEMAVKSFLQDYYCTPDTWSVKRSGTRVLTAMNSWLYAQMQGHPDRLNRNKGYVCTFSGMVLKSNTGHLFHSGDSRIYRVMGQSLEQLTNDHKQYGESGKAYLARAMGFYDFIEFDYRTINLTEGDIFILATDGLYEFLSPEVMIDAINNGLDHLQDVAEALLQQALDAGSDDNLTLQIIHVASLPTHGIDELHDQAINLPKPPQLAARMQFDGYQIIRDLYISSRSHVYLAKDLDTDQNVVLKLPSTELSNDEDYLENMLMEDWIAHRIDNAHVMKAIPPTRKRNYLYTVTEYIEGKHLGQWMIDNPAPSLDTVRDIVEQIAKGLQAFHRQEMVHQDLRPNNIMIDASGTVKIIDFGATKVAGISEIKPKNEGIVGTAQYTAPEYYLGELGTSRSDLFSLGVIAYQLLSRQLPYGNAVSLTKSQKDQHKLVYRSLLLDHHETVPGWIDFAIEKATNVNPLKRYDEVSEFIYDLKHPNNQYLAKRKPPLIETNPVLIWQLIAAVLFIELIWQSL